MVYLPIVFTLLSFVLAWRTTRNFAFGKVEWNDLGIILKVLFFLCLIVNAINWSAVVLLTAAQTGLVAHLDIPASTRVLLISSIAIYLVSIGVHIIALRYRRPGRYSELDYQPRRNFMEWLRDAKDNIAYFWHDNEYNAVVILLLIIIGLQLRSEITYIASHIASFVSTTFTNTQEVATHYPLWWLILTCIAVGTACMVTIFRRICRSAQRIFSSPLCSSDRIPWW